jgi:hypothetical protein
MPMPIPRGRASDVGLLDLARTGHLDCKRPHVEQLLDDGLIELGERMNGTTRWTVSEAGRRRVVQLGSSIVVLRQQFRREL